MSYVKCIKCELNYIKDNEKLCSICKSIVEHENPAILERERHPIGNVAFIIKNGISPQSENKIKVSANSRQILVYDKKNRCVGVVYKHNETRVTPANGQAEICFFDQYYSEFGKWHRMFLNEHRLGFERIKNILNTQKEFIYSAQIRD